MVLYARSPARRRRQIGIDLFVLCWILCWGWIARSVWSALMAVVEPTRRTAAAAVNVRDDFRSAGDRAGGLPLAGEELRKPFDMAAGSLDSITIAAQDQIRSLERLALLCGLLLFIVPAGLVIVVWLPARLKFIRAASVTKGLLDSPHDLELIALRAMATQPLDTLARISGDPVKDWREGRWAVIVALADLELRTMGLSVPEGLREESPGDDRPDQSP